MAEAAASSGDSLFEQLKKVTVVVADSGEIELIKKFKPTDATTNPSLIYKAAQLPEYKSFVDDAVAFGEANAGGDKALETELCLDKLAVNFGVEILKHIDGQISTEVDARLSFTIEKNVQRARRIMGLYEAAGIGKDRVLIKLASTWEGLQAAKTLQAEGIRCNMTLMFTLCQAAVAADVGATLVSPFVGRIRDYHVAHGSFSLEQPADEDPGVVSVRQIWAYYKKHGFDTVVMGASFRSLEEVTALAGCDRLTISPALLDALSARTGEALPTALDAADAAVVDKYLPAGGAKLALDEEAFRWMLNEDPMATEKLSEGIRAFAADLVKLEKFIEAPKELIPGAVLVPISVR